MAPLLLSPADSERGAAVGCSHARRVLVTGGAGFIGQHLVARLQGLGVGVVVLDDLSTGSREKLYLSHGRLVHASVLDRAALAAAAKGIDLVFHLASVVGMRQAYLDPGHAFRVSDEGTRNVLAVTGQVPVVLMSSSAVLGLKPAPLASDSRAANWQTSLEYDAGRPGYSCGKAALEQHGLAAMAAGREVMIVRPFNVVGPGQRSDFGMVLPTFVERALAGQVLCVHGDGQQCRSFADVRTFVDCVLRLVEQPAAWTVGANTINVGDARVTSIRALAELVLQETRSTSAIEYVPYASVFPGKRDVRFRRPDTARLESLIGRVVWRDLRSVVREFVDESQAGQRIASIT